MQSAIGLCAVLKVCEESSKKSVERIDANPISKRNVIGVLARSTALMHTESFHVLQQYNSFFHFSLPFYSGGNRFFDLLERMNLRVDSKRSS